MTDVKGVYLITNNTNGKQYVGSSVDVKRRWDTHKSKLRGGYHTNKHLQSAWNKYGEDAFSFKLLLLCDDQYLLDFEQRCLDQLKPAYNMTARSSAPMLGHCHTAETKAKISAARKGMKFTEEHRANMAKARLGKKIPGRKSVVFSEEHKKNLSIATKRAWEKRKHGR